MTTAFQERALPLGLRPRLVSTPLLLNFATMFGASASFYLLLSVVPLYGAAHAAGQNLAGLATGVLMGATVAGELASPRLVARLGNRVTLAAGLVLLGAPALALALPPSVALILAVCATRGLGFAITVVVGGSLTATLVPKARQGEGLALAGVVSGVPALAALPLGVWLAGVAGFPLVFVAGAITALAALAAVPGLPGRAPAGPAGRTAGSAASTGADSTGAEGAAGQPIGVLAGLRSAALLPPAAAFAATTTAAGVMVTFLPLVMTGATQGVVALALFAQPAAATLTRWLAGRHTDRHGPAGLLIPAVAATAGGVALLALSTGPAAAVAGSLVFGAGFGVAQNVTLSLMYARMPVSSYDTVSAVWNLAYDGGMGVGAAGFGLLAGGTGYPAAFALTGAVVLTALLPACRDRRRPSA